MSDLSDLKPHAERLLARELGSLAGVDPDRDAALVIDAAGLTLDARHQRLDAAAWETLTGLARSAGVEARRDALLAGEVVNETENRPALHPALRNPDRLRDPALAERLRSARAATRRIAEAAAAPDFLDGHPVRRVINIGIGGSDLGPRFLYDALKGFRRDGVEVRFVSNLDPADLDDAMEGADPAATLVCVTSKSFTTQETLMNARAARARLAETLGEDGARARFLAATAAPARAAEFGVAEDRIFPFEDGVGGRYSVWSAAGLCLEIGLGPDVFDRLLAGARAMDDHFAESPLERNMPVAKGLIDVWSRAGLGRLTRCVAAYASRLEKLPAYLQQLEMESLGKRVTRAGAPLADGHGGQLVWGGRGSDVQHSFFQWLHQALSDAPVDFIALESMAASSDERARALTANLVAQGAALLTGRVEDGDLAAHRFMPGGRSSSVLILPDVDPESLGALIALHEHKVFVESVLYDINPFDQWGVELGKQLARSILSGDVTGFDSATLDLLRRLGVGGA